MIFGKRKDGRFYKVDSNDGELVNAIGTPIHNTQQESKIRLITRQLERNQSIRESHEEKQRRRRLQQAEREKQENQRKAQLHSIIDEIETRRRVLQQAKKNPEILDRLQQANPKGGALPKNFQKQQTEQSKKFFKEETDKLNSVRGNTSNEIQGIKDQIDSNLDAIKKMRNEVEELRKHESNIPEINQENNRKQNDLIMEISKLESHNEQLHKDIDVRTDDLKKAEKQIERLNFLNKDNAFGTVSNLPDENKPTLPKGTIESRERAKESYEARKTGKGTAPIFPEGFEHKRKIRNPITGKEFLTNKLPDNKKFVGFDKSGEPVFVEKEERQEHEEPTENYTPKNETDNQTEGQQLRIIPGLAKEV